MPSGSKKRKAAKKKKENRLPNSSSPASAQSHDGDVVKQKNDKESDVGEVSSPASQDHQNPLTEGEEEENPKEDDIVVEEGNGMQVEREFKTEDESRNKNGEMEHDEPARKSYDGDSSGNSSSSSNSTSDDESHDIKISQAEVEISPVIDSVKETESLSGTTAYVIHSAEIEESVESVVENLPAIDLEKIETAEIYITSEGDDSVACEAVEALSKENKEKKLSVIEDQVGFSLPIVSAAANAEGEIQSGENSFEILDPKAVAPQVDDVTGISYDAPVPYADNRKEHEKDSGVTQPLLVPTSHAAQTTSWKSCCGLFELFTNSDR